MKKKVSLLVLGVGGNVSQGIIKALKMSENNMRYKVVGACVNPMAAGLYFADKAYISPMADSENFLQWILDICRKENIDGILSGVEQVLNVLARHKDYIFQEVGAVCVVSRTDKLAIGQDKLLTCEWLEEKGLNFPRYALAEERASVFSLFEECGYPLIAKPRRGKGSEGIFKICNSIDFEYALNFRDYIFQEYLGVPEEEYTVGGFCDKKEKVRGIISMRRELLGGTTYRAEVVDAEELRKEAERILLSLKPTGPCNMQFRVDNSGKPVCFEINLRFSGTTPFRAHLGFNDVDAAVRHYVLNEDIDDFSCITGGIALRYWNEVFVNPAAVKKMEQCQFLESKNKLNWTADCYDSN